MQQLRALWQGGYEGQHIEELIGSVFADFAPYAGADQQRLILSRQHDTTATTALIVEDNGDYSVSCTHLHAGTVSFSSTGELQAQVALRVPLIPVSPQAWWAQRHIDRAAGSTPSANTPQLSPPAGPLALRHAAPQAAQPVLPASPHKEDKAVQQELQLSSSSPDATHNPLRFTSYARGAYLLTGLPHTTAPAYSAGLGQLELDATLPSLWQGRHSYGVRCGPLASRLAITPHREEIAPPGSAASPDALRSGEEEEDAARGKTLQHQQYTFDAAVCIPLQQQQQQQQGNEDADAATEHWAVSLGMQHPEPYGDTLLALALQNSRMTPCTPCSSQHVVSKTEDVAAAMHDKSEAAGNIKPVAENVGIESARQSRPGLGFRVLLVQTLLSRTLLAPDASLLSQDNGTTTSATLRDLSQRIVAADKTWYALPTLVGCNISALHDLVRCSAAAIFHDNTVDLETALVLDATPLVPHIPSLLRVGWNNAGRVAVGITSLVGHAVSLTLGIDYTRGETPRFGIDLHA